MVKHCVVNHWQMRSAKCLKAPQKADLRGAVAWMWWHGGVPMSQFWLAFWLLCWCRSTRMCQIYSTQNMKWTTSSISVIREFSDWRFYWLCLIWKHVCIWGSGEMCDSLTKDGITVQGTRNKLWNVPPITWLVCVMKKGKKVIGLVPLLHGVTLEPTVGFVAWL